jgi:hypothetical protein
MQNFIVTGGDPSLIMPPAFGQPLGPAMGAPGQFPQFPTLGPVNPQVVTWIALVVLLVAGYKISSKFQG